MGPETLLVRRRAFDIEEPWSVPAGCQPARLRRANDAAPPRLATSVAAWFDDEMLTVLFSAADDHVRATYVEHDSPLYEEDAFEMFLAPDRLERYYEIEVSPRGTLFDAVIESPDGVRATMRVDRTWNAQGLFAVVRHVTESDGTGTLDIVVRIPFAAIVDSPPAPGDEWRGNFFRIDRHSERGDEFSAWQPTLRDPADFHVATVFGSLRFSE